MQRKFIYSEIGFCNFIKSSSHRFSFMLIHGFGANCYFDNSMNKILGKKSMVKGQLVIDRYVGGGGGAEMKQMISLSKNTFSF